MSIFRIILVAIPLLLTGCYSALREIEWAARPTSKYQPSLASISNINNYIELIKSSNNKMVEDELGTYHHSLTGDWLLRTYFRKQDEGVLKNLFNTSTGLLEPVYIYKNSELGPKASVNWDATERRHSLFTNKLHLKLLPLSATKHYQEVLEKEAIENFTPSGINFSAKTRGTVFNKSGLRADYIISGGLFEDFYINYPRHNWDFSQEVENYDYASERIIESPGILFIPTQIARESISGKVYISSSCQYINIGEYKRNVSKRMDDYFLPVKVTKLESDVATDINSLKIATEINNEKKLAEARKRFEAATLKQAQNGENEEKACETGIAAIGVSGYINSNRLK